MNENELFAAYQAAEGEQKAQLREDLARALLKHAFSVCWVQLKEYEPDVANWCVHKAFQKLHRFRGDALFSTWFHKIVLNACTSSLRDKLKRRETPLDDLNEDATGRNDSGIEATTALGQIAAMLEPDDREFLDMRLRGMDDIAIGAVIGLSREGTRVKWHRLRKRIMRKLAI